MSSSGPWILVWKLEHHSSQYGEPVACPKATLLFNVVLTRKPVLQHRTADMLGQLKNTVLLLSTEKAHLVLWLSQSFFTPSKQLSYGREDSKALHLHSRKKNTGKAEVAWSSLAGCTFSTFTEKNTCEEAKT